MKVIPAIDIIDGQCVRLEQGNYDIKKVYDSDPAMVAKRYQDYGIQHLHVVDLDGAKAGKIINWKVLEKIAHETTLTIDFGGGIKSDEDIMVAFNAGAHQVTCGSIAVKNPALVAKWINIFGAEKLILGADVKDKMVAINGWTETSTMSINSLLEMYHEKGLHTAICTDIATDGMLLGPNTVLYKELLGQYPWLNLIASGGVSCMADLQTLKAAGLHGVIIGKAIYENKISLQELKDFIDA